MFTTMTTCDASVLSPSERRLKIMYCTANKNISTIFNGDSARFNGAQLSGSPEAGGRPDDYCSIACSVVATTHAMPRHGCICRKAHGLLAVRPIIQHTAVQS